MALRCGVRWEPFGRVRLFRLAWDLTGTPFGSRQALHERFFNGDVVRPRQARYQAYDDDRAVGMVDTFLNGS